jgi:hypothetical protein
MFREAFQSENVDTLDPNAAKKSPLDKQESAVSPFFPIIDSCKTSNDRKKDSSTKTEAQVLLEAIKNILKSTASNPSLEGFPCRHSVKDNNVGRAGNGPTAGLGIITPLSLSLTVSFITKRPLNNDQ